MTCDAKLIHHKRMDNCKRILEFLQQNRTPIQIKKIAKKLKIDDGTVYRHVASLELQGKVYFERGKGFVSLKKEPSQYGSPERYFQWRGQEVRFWKAMFGDLPKKEGES